MNHGGSRGDGGHISGEQLPTQDRFLSAVLDALAHPFYVLDAQDYTVGYANSAAHSAGLRQQEKCYTLTHGRSSPCNSPAHPCPLKHIVETRRPVTVEHIHLAADGTERCVEVHAYPMFDAAGSVTRVIEFSLDVTERRRAERKAVQEAAVAEERSRLARELHDSVTQALFSAGLVAEVLPQVWSRNPQEVMTGLEELRRITGSALADMRALLLELEPADLLDVGLDELIGQLTAGVKSRTKINVSQNLEPVPKLPPDVQIAFYRICQEALQNIVKHAHAAQAAVHLRAFPPAFPGAGDWRGHILLQVSDDGRGFDVELVPADCKGLRMMAERARAIGASLSVDSDPGEGTQLTLRWGGQ